MVYRACSTNGRDEKCIQENMKGEDRLLGMPRGRWEDNIKMDLKEMRCEGME
jgi:hypothetical protein